MRDLIVPQCLVASIARHWFEATLSIQEILTIALGRFPGEHKELLGYRTLTFLGEANVKKDSAACVPCMATPCRFCTGALWGGLKAQPCTESKECRTTHLHSFLNCVSCCEYEGIAKALLLGLAMGLGCPAKRYRMYSSTQVMPLCALPLIAMGISRRIFSTSCTLGYLANILGNFQT